jgi:PAS domain-containing protein
MIRPDHPLTSRVMVNRIWKHHFERGIVTTLDNFGRAGGRPSHPELLDWLAVKFVENGWSIKSMHRLIMNSAVYRQSSQVTSRHERMDPENRWLSRMPLRRMEGEVLRDTLFFVAGRLDLTPFGPPDPVAVREDGLVTSGGKTGRRSVYVLKRRTQPLTILQNFDIGQMDPNCVDRTESIVATQALHLNNNQLVRQLAEAFARRIWEAESDDPCAQIERAFLIAFGRSPSDDERQISLDTLRRMQVEWARTNVGTRHVLTASKQIWVREIEPERIFENDLISVWSSRSTDKGRRFGLVEFDLRTVSGLQLIRAELELGVLDTKPIRQSAALIPPGIEHYNWALYQQNKSPHTRTLDGLGRYDSDVGSERIGSYATSEPATPQELIVIETRAKADGRLSLVLIADEDGKAYRRDWDDGVYRTTRHNSPRLVIYDSRSDVDAASRLALENLCHALINSASFLYID